LVARNELLEKILEARYEYDYAPRESKSAAEKILMGLVDKAIAGTRTSRYELLAATHDRYLELKRQRRKKEKVSISERLQ
jgi:hypothetical protein